jgi:hypothetical protein
MPSFAERIGRHSRYYRPSKIYLIRGNDSTGQPAWYYLCIDRGKKHRFELSATMGQIQLTDFGRIIISGYGEYPPPEVKKRMKDEYGFEE